MGKRVYLSVVCASLLIAQNLMATSDFYLADNGVTIKCENASLSFFNKTGVVNGVTYTKREKADINQENAATTCTSGITDMSNLFIGKSTFNANISHWDTGSVTNMFAMFQNATAFNKDLSNWDVSKVTNMSNMFRNATAFNQNIGNWDVSSVTNMTIMFYNATTFNQDIGNCDVSKVTNMGDMFRNAIAFNQDIGDWDVSSVTNMNFMFYGATAFNKNIDNWDVSKVIGMSNIFNGATAFNKDLSNWNVSKVTDMGDMFRNAIAFNQDIGDWNVSKVTDMSNMFNGASAFNQNIGDWNVSKVTAMWYMFNSASTFNQNIGNWDVSSVSNMNYMFAGATLFNQDLSDWCVSSITSKPMTFDNNSEFMDETTKQPQWGTCPLNLISTSPVNNAVNIAVDSDIVLEFSKNIAFASSGEINISKSSDNSVIFNVDLQNNQLSITDKNFTINPTTNLDYDTSYYVTISKDAIARSGRTNKFKGISDDSVLKFTTSVPPNATPTDINISNNSIAENSTIATVIGELNATDSDIDDTHTFSFCGGVDNNFTISGNELKTAIELDYETRNSYVTCIKVNDGVANYEKNLTINVLNVNENPIWSIENNETLENTNLDMNLSKFISDVDSNSFTFSAESNNTNLATISLIESNLSIIPVTNAFGVVGIKVYAYDGDNNISKDINITINNINDKPTFTIPSNITKDMNFAVFNITLSNINDLDRDDLNITVDMNDNSIIGINSLWENNLTYANYFGKDLNFTVSPISDKFGVVELNISANDGNIIVSKEMNITVNYVAPPTPTPVYYEPAVYIPISIPDNGGIKLQISNSAVQEVNIEQKETTSNEKVFDNS